MPHLGMDRIGVPDQACANSIRLAPSFVLRGKAGRTGRAPLILPLIMTLAALIALFIVLIGALLAEQRQPRSDRRQRRRRASAGSR